MRLEYRLWRGPTQGQQERAGQNSEATAAALMPEPCVPTSLLLLLGQVCQEGRNSLPWQCPW